MIDFSTLKGLTIPEGVVTQISDAIGRVLWSAAPKGVTVTIVVSDVYRGNCEITIDGVIYTSAAIVTVPAGTRIGIAALTDGDGRPRIYVKGAVVVSGEGSTDNWDDCTYEYIAVRDTTITLANTKDAGCVYIDPAQYATKPAVLEVEKITSDTYAGETTYTGEQFILLDIYPQTVGSVVNVTYGGLTKTLAFSGANAQQVYFGTFNGVSDSVATPASGTLTIEGDYDGIAVGTYKQYSNNKATNKYCSCITAVSDFGSILSLTDLMFYQCTQLTHISLPNNIVAIGNSAFCRCTGLTSITIPDGVTYLGSSAFSGCTGLTRVDVLATVPPENGKSMFGSVECYILVPTGCIEAYRTADGWSEYADRIVEAS